MSGPKSADYYLSAAERARRAELERQRQQRLLEEARKKREAEEEARRLAEARKENAALGTQLAGQLSTLRSELDALKPILREDPAAEKQLTDFRKFLAQNGQIQTRSNAAKSSQVLEQNAKIQKIIRETELMTAACRSTANAIRSGLKARLDVQIMNGLSVSFADIGKDRRAPEPEPEQKYDAGDIFQRIEALTLSNEQRNRVSGLKAQADGFPTYQSGKEFAEAVLIPFERECREYSELYDEYEDERVRYRALATEAGAETASFAYTREGLREMRSAAEALEADILKCRERAYIHESMDEIMREMGYRVVGGRVHTGKRTGKRTRHALYQLTGGTAVDVTYSENGQISMELGGLGDENREPTAEEAAVLTEDMRAFCGDYAEFVRRLKDRGILTDPISMLPPEPAYAQIINTEAYDMIEETEMMDIRRRRSATDTARRMGE